MMRGAPIVVSLVLAGLLAACASPEATRPRAGGRGADVGNRGPVVVIHDGADPYWRTPRVDIAARSGGGRSHR
jgi:hypothetical protein